MAVGPNFQSSETQAAIQQQAAQQNPAEPEPTIPPAQQQNPAPAVKPQEPQVDPATKTGDAEPAKGGLDLTFSAEPTKPAEGQKIAPATEVTNDALEAAGIKVTDIVTQIKENSGKVPDTLKESLSGKFTQEAIDAAVKQVEENYIKAQEINKPVQDMNTYIFETLADGDATKGKDNFVALSGWCQKNMDKAQLDAINTLLRSDNKDVVRQGLQQAVDAWKKGKEKPMMSGDSSADVQQPQNPGFEPLDRDEYVAIMSTEKYNTDAEYAAKIDERRKKTLDQGNARFFTPEYSKYRPVRR